MKATKSVKKGKALELGKKSYSEMEEELEKVKRYFHEEILRKDDIIKRLKEENGILVATTIKQGRRLDDFNERLAEMHKKVKKD